VNSRPAESYGVPLIIIIIIIFGSAAQRELWPPRSRSFLIKHNDKPQSVGLLWTSDNTQQISMPPVGLEPTITAGERP
jgi:hypothetical protein